MFFSVCCRVGIDLPTVEVRFENVKIEAEAYVGSRALPTFLNFFINIAEVCVRFSNLVQIDCVYIS